MDPINGARSVLSSGLVVFFAASAAMAQNNVVYVYDELGRVTSTCRIATTELVEYRYDKAGNRANVDITMSACGPAYFSVDDATPALEGGNLTFTITRSGNISGANDINYASADGAAVAASDYTATSGALSFLAGESSKTVQLQTLSDAVFEVDEDVVLNLSGATNGAIISDGQGVGLIKNNAATSSVMFSIANASVAEGGTLVFTVTKSGSTNLAHDVDFATANGTATSADYTANSGMLSFAPADVSKTISIATTDDTIFENNETLFVSLSNATNGAAIAQSSGSGTIAENDSAPSFSIANTSIAEGGALVFTVTKTGATTLTHSVNYATANGAAIAGADYTSASGTLTFAATDTSKTFSVSTIDDNVYENNELMYANLSSATNSASISIAQGSGAINNNDAAPTFSVSDASATAGGNLIFTITKSGPTAVTHAVNYATANGTAIAGAHYTAQSSSLAFASGQTSNTVSIATTSGSLATGSKNMYLNLSNATNNATFSDAQGLGAINAPPNSPPNAVNDTRNGTFNVGDWVTVYVLANDTDPDGHSLSITGATCTSSGCTRLIGSNYVQVKGTTFGKKYVTYTISDGHGGSDTATIIINSFTDSGGCSKC